MKHYLVILAGFLFYCAPTPCEELKTYCNDDCVDPQCAMNACIQELATVDSDWPELVGYCVDHESEYLERCAAFCNSLADSNQQENCQDGLDTFMCHKNDSPNGICRMRCYGGNIYRLDCED